MLEYYLLALIEQAAYEAADQDRLSMDKPLVEGYPTELDGGNVVVHTLTFNEAVWDIHGSMTQLWGMGWDTHQLDT